jgi:crotonobetainyl-CoA:carnitine CoA-transferase CaiB-like acyl-CoA transferase
MHDAMLYWVMLPAARDLVDGGAEAEGELPTFGGHASYNVYRTADGLLVALGALERKFWVAFCAGIGRPDLAARHATSESDQADLINEMRAVFGSRTRDEWLSLMAGHDVCLTPVNTPQEALRDPHAIARGVVQPTAGMRAIRPPFLCRVPDLSPPPAVGQHTREVIAGLTGSGR